MFDTKPYEKKMDDVLERFEGELRKFRTGRAHPGILDSIRVEAYGTFMPLNQVANVTAPEAQMLLVSAYDPSHISAISKAIRDDQSLGLNPSDDGKVVRVPIPPLSEERRELLVKQAGEKVEEARIGLRTVRQEAFKEIKRMKDDKEFSEDDARRSETAIDDVIGSYTEKIEATFDAKKQELLTV